ncbi:hypothetical protein [Prochlorococcus sp. MIT 0801]|uniref:hypothetical protein n=1 Tax=Prochlorococcus sp. MIT 0801 TaxID=1501269 RepID=UPI0012E06B91|nr:hypothetical protein [Prochlorococcus sp. MIT 0801]
MPPPPIPEKPAITGFFYAFITLLKQLNVNNHTHFAEKRIVINQARTIPVIGLIRNQQK